MSRRGGTVTKRVGIEEAESVEYSSRRKSKCLPRIPRSRPAKDFVEDEEREAGGEPALALKRESHEPKSSRVLSTLLLLVIDLAMKSERTNSQHDSRPSRLRWEMQDSERTSGSTRMARRDPDRLLDLSQSGKTKQRAVSFSDPHCPER
ncbi:hypothetical protein KM043_003760 [Ampulex compressa]|nr:hypothetical protein KM043_003760 [Ampulex compressa]